MCHRNEQASYNLTVQDNCFITEMFDKCSFSDVVFLEDVKDTLPWIRGPRETKERKVGEEDGPLAERDKPL